MLKHAIHILYSFNFSHSFREMEESDIRTNNVYPPNKKDMQKRGN